MPEPAASAYGSSDFPAWVLLDTVAKIGRCENETTAHATTSAGLPIEVSFILVDPPSLSRCVFNCPAPPCSACVTGADGAFLLVRVFFPERDGKPMLTDVFVYRAGPGTPSLFLLPRPYPVRLHSCYVGVLSSGPGADGGEHHCSVVVPERRINRVDRRVRYDLRVFSTETASWSTRDPKVACHADGLYGEFEPTRVFAVGGGSLAWVDLQFGILLCKDVEGDDDDTEMRLIQLPPLMPGNKVRYGVGSDGCSPPMDPIRDVTFSSRDGCFRFVEMEFLGVDGSAAWRRRWRATIFKRRICSENWELCGAVGSDDLSTADDSCLPDVLFPEINDDHEEEKKLTLSRVMSSVPTLDQYHDDVVYMVSKMIPTDTHGWIFAVNTGNKTLEKAAPFSAERLYHHRAYLQCAFSKYLSKQCAFSEYISK
ncbi:unnamed protein product [Urochloa humidicola]